MVCPKCGSFNVSVQVVNEAKLVDVHHGFFWWLFIGWWWLPIKWIFFFLPALIIKIFGHKKQKIVQHQVTYCICQNCGCRWKI